jgi:hypothetical protein
MHLSKIFNFLSSGTYSSLGVNFFRFPFGPGWWRWEIDKGNGSDIPPLIREVENIIQAFLTAKQINERQRYLESIKNYYYQLQAYQGNKQAQKTIDKVRQILEENGLL